MERISKHQMFMDIAKVLAMRGNCGRGQVGALLTQENRIISTGYNGPLRGSEDCSAEHCDLNNHCKRSIHAEVNAIYFAAKQGISTDNSTLYCTHSPCVNCAKAIVQAGIYRVIYLYQYDEEGIKLLMLNGVKIVNWDGK